MKTKKFIITLFIIFSLVWGTSVRAFAMDTGFSTNKMDLKDQETFLANIELSSITQETQNNGILCFDVNDDGMIAIGTAALDKKYVYIYNADGIFQYGYEFNCNQSFGVEWDNENLIIYFVRSDVAASFDKNGVNVELKVIQNTIENNSYWNHSVFAKQRMVDTNLYSMTNNMGFFNIFASAYSQIIQTDVNGNSKIVYDVSSEYKVNFTVMFVAMLLFVICVVTILLSKIKKFNQHTL